MEIRNHYETQEEVEKALKALNHGVMPFLVYTSPKGIKHYSDWLNNAISVIPDPVVHPSAKT